jgi:hypothetical protein
MNLADSMKNVLKHKSHIFTNFWKEDLMQIFTEVGHDFGDMIKNSGSSFKKLKENGVKVSAHEFMDSASDTILIFKVLPSRIKDGFHYFKEDLTSELEIQTDQKQKTIFSLKVIGALTGFTLGVIYNVKKGKSSDFSLKGLRRSNAFTQFIVAEIVFKVTQLIIQRFLIELEKEVTEPDDLKHIVYFRELLTNREKVDETALQLPANGDRAIEIVDNLKKYIMTGKR